MASGYHVGQRRSDNVANIDDNDDHIGIVFSSWESKFLAQGADKILGTHASWMVLEA